MPDQSVNAFVLRQARRCLGLYKTARARLSGKRFACRALSGGSEYNISVNCDMTVSCSCADGDGSGEIGDLSSQTLAEVFDGPQATALRRRMTQGRLPLLQCATCPDALAVPREQADHCRTHYSTPTLGIMVENTVCCNYRCRSCERQRILQHRRKTRLDLEDIKNLSLMVQQYHIRSVAYFKLGEAFSSPTILEELRILRGDNPELTLLGATNGSLIDDDRKREAALLMDSIHVSIDGTDNRSVGRYQRGGSFDRAYGNLRDLVAYRNARGCQRPSIEWKYVVFNWNDKPAMLEKAIELAGEAQVNGISFWPAWSPFYGVSWRYLLKGYRTRPDHRAPAGCYVHFH